MKNLLRILMFVLIVGAVFFASDFLINQNENYKSIDEQKTEESVDANNSGEELLEDLLTSGDENFSGEAEAFSGEVIESGEVVKIVETPEEAMYESGDEVVESGELGNN